MAKFKVITIVLISVLFCGCGGKLNGKYSYANGQINLSYDFKPDGTVIIDQMGAQTQFKYELNGKEVKLITPRGDAVLTMPDADTIIGPMGAKLVKQK